MQKVCDILKKIEFGFIGLCLAGMVAVIFIATVGRYSQLYVTPWSEEAARYLMIWLAFVGAGCVARMGLHFGVDVLVNKFPQKGRFVMYIIQAVIVTLICIWIGYYGFQITITQIAMHKTSPSMGLPMYIVSLCVPYTAISTGLQNLYYQICKMKKCLNGNADLPQKDIITEGGENA